MCRPQLYAVLESSCIKLSDPHNGTFMKPRLIIFIVQYLCWTVPSSSLLLCQAHRDAQHRVSQARYVSQYKNVKRGSVMQTSTSIVNVSEQNLTPNYTKNTSPASTFTKHKAGKLRKDPIKNWRFCTKCTSIFKIFFVIIGLIVFWGRN